MLLFSLSAYKTDVVRLMTSTISNASYCVSQILEVGVKMTFVVFWYFGGASLFSINKIFHGDKTYSSSIMKKIYENWILWLKDY